MDRMHKLYSLVKIEGIFADMLIQGRSGAFLGQTCGLKTLMGDSILPVGDKGKTDSWRSGWSPADSRQVRRKQGEQAMKRSANGGFTLVEILIVVIILGILAAIVIPQFTQASTEARISNLKTNLQTVRSQVELYHSQHRDTYPDAGFFDQMTLVSDASGATVSSPDDTHKLGPYLKSIPANPISNLNTVRIVSGATTAFSAPTSDGGWWYNSTSGEYRADLKDSWTDSDGTKFNVF